MREKNGRKYFMNSRKKSLPLCGIYVALETCGFTVYLGYSAPAPHAK